MNALGIDLGTANTYIYQDVGSGLPMPVVLPGMSDNAGSMATVVLYEKETPILAGNIAEEEYYSHPSLARSRYLASQFKPEIALNDEIALKAATDFLAQALKKLPQGILLKDTVLTVGMPALAREDFKLNLKECFIKAGWPAPEFARESDAALVSALQSGALSAADIGRKCLIVDFGGGTYDYTTVEKLDVLQNGGDVLYGGRLFDDLFYQAFCRENEDFATHGPESPYLWHAHWLECKREKEKFSDFLSRHTAAEASLTLRILWHDSDGKRHEAYLKDYSKEQFLRDAENYAASPDLLRMLAPYQKRGGLSRFGRDLLAGMQTGLISWLRDMLHNIRERREVSRIILTGGSSRWFFVHELCEEIFPGASTLTSSRGYEDIAFGLALYPGLIASQEKAQTLLRDQLGVFTKEAVSMASDMVAKHAQRVARLCSERIVERDVMPALEQAQNESMTAAELEERFSRAIQEDNGLIEIVAASSEDLRKEIEHGLNYSFRRWLNDNGVPLAPTFDFPVGEIGRDFFEGIKVKISRLDTLNLMSFTLRTILPILAGTATAGAIMHSGEPVSTIVGGGAAFGVTWLLARATPRWLEQRKLPSFILNERNRKKIASKNREYIETELLKSFESLRESLSRDIESRIKDTLKAMIGSLSALNQVAR